MIKWYNPLLEKDAIEIVILKNGNVLFGSDVYITLKKTALVVNRPYKTVVSWVEKGSKAGVLRTLELFNQKFVCDSDLMEYLLRLRVYQK
jgi:hypothetical protein